MIFLAISVIIFIILIHGFIIELIIESIKDGEWFEVIICTLFLISLVSADIGLFTMRTKGV